MVLIGALFFGIRLHAAEFHIPVEGLTGALYDPRLNRLYLSSSTQGAVLRFDWATREFLSPLEVGGKPGALELTADGRTLLVADLVQQGTDEVLHRMDLLSQYTSARLIPGLSAVFHPVRPLLFVSYLYSNVVEVLDLRSMTLVDSLPYAGPTSLPTNVPRPSLGITPDGTQILVPASDGVRVLDYRAEAFSLTSATRFGVSNRITLVFSGPVAPSTVTNLAHYILEPAGAVIAASYSSNAPTLITLQVQGSAERVRVSGVEGRGGDPLTEPAIVSIVADPWMPVDTGTWVEGFQDGFNRPGLGSNWVAYAQLAGLDGLPVWRLDSDIALSRRCPRAAGCRVPSARWPDACRGHTVSVVAPTNPVVSPRYAV